MARPSLKKPIAYEADIRQTLRNLGMSERELQHELGGYLPMLDAIEGGIPEITQLLNEPHYAAECLEAM